jgi:Domain of unknown function (DUF4384)
MDRHPVVRHRQLLPILFAAIGLIAFGTAGMAQTDNSVAAMTIRLEQRKEKTTRSVPQNKVFHAGDVLRFRVRSNISGYLYVLDVGTSGETTVLFPSSAGSDGQTRIPATETRSVPTDGDGWFEMTGPPGYDILYFLMSADLLPLGVGSQQNKKGTSEEVPNLPQGLEPRCDEEIFRSRGDCIDKSAGIVPLGPHDTVPRQLTPFSSLVSRDITVVEDSSNSTVRASKDAKLPLIYTVRLAHVR